MDKAKLAVVVALAIIISILIIGAVGLSVFQQDEMAGQIESAQDLANYFQNEMKSQDIPALAVLIFDQNTVLFEGYYGDANVAVSSELTEDDMFLLASISKTVTATALLQLYDQGEFDLDDPINDYLPFQVESPMGYQDDQITFKMLLTHTAGVADSNALDDQYFYGEDSPIKLRDFLESYLVAGGRNYDEQDNFHDFAPGAEFEYSNTDSALIGLLVEEISGQSFVSYTRENIFAPLGMSNTFWRLGSIENARKSTVSLYDSDNLELEVYTFTDYPNGGLRSTAQDLYKFLNVFTHNGSYDGSQILSPATIASITTPQIPEIAEEVGLHMFLLNKEQNLWGHDGGEEGTSTIMAFNPETKIGVIILGNKSDIELDEMLVDTYLWGFNLPNDQSRSGKVP